MPDIFVDTAGWASLMDPSQKHHAPATRIYRDAKRNGRMLVTTNYVITELVALLTSPFRLSRPRIIAAITALKTSPHVKIIHNDEVYDGKAWLLLTKREDKQWSLVDCSSFVLMQELGLTEALTLDHHFEQARFSALLHEGG